MSTCCRRSRRRRSRLQRAGAGARSCPEHDGDGSGCQRIFWGVAGGLTKAETCRVRGQFEWRGWRLGADWERGPGCAALNKDVGLGSRAKQEGQGLRGMAMGCIMKTNWVIDKSGHRRIG
eukprot:2971480-Pleurochrysis_carterae.AAC.2